METTLRLTFFKVLQGLLNPELLLLIFRKGRNAYLLGGLSLQSPCVFEAVLIYCLQTWVIQPELSLPCAFKKRRNGLWFSERNEFTVELDRC